MHPSGHDHDKLAVHPVRDTSMTGDEGVEVLDAIGSLDARHEEATKRRNQRCEAG